LWLFGLLSLSPPAWETFIMLVLPVILIAVLFLVPFLSNRGERAPSRRPVAVLAVVVIYTALGVLTYQGVTSPWSPQMTAWSGDPVPEDLVQNCSPLGLQGAALFQNKSCRNCHALEGIGGRRGPDLTAVGTRLTRDQLIDQVSNGTPGGGNMPAYGKQISAPEMTALAEFLANLRPDGAPPAEPATLGSGGKQYP
jgi:ubiquinol-cytochrome c reductase cytochrome b subunit